VCRYEKYDIVLATLDDVVNMLIN